MNFTTQNLKTERQWRSSTGMDKPRFDKLLTAFQAAFERHFGQTMQERQANNPQDCVVTSYEELLFFTLFSFRADLVYDLLGLVVGFDSSNAKRTESLGIIVLQEALYELGHTPTREFKTPEEFKEYFKKHVLLIIDGTEQRRQRPTDYLVQKKAYSGKKKPTLHSYFGIGW